MADEYILKHLQDEYESVEPEFLWGLVIRHIPRLKEDIERLMDEYEPFDE